MENNTGKTWVDNIIDEPSEGFKQKEPKLYEEHQRKIDFLSKFKDGENLYKHDNLFKALVDTVAKGACFYDLINALFIGGAIHLINKEESEK